jgi:RNA polymerase sigma factor (sigma-70 family)
VEASALHAPAALGRLPLATPLLRLRSDDQLIALFRAGSDDAFRVLHDRYRQRLFAYIRQMLSSHSRQDAEDVLQDVFVRAFGALRGDTREVNVRAWLYRVAHNRCIDHLRRPVPPPAEIFEMSRKPLHDPVDEAQRRDDLRRLVADVGRLPDQQRSALLMREIDGMSYADLAAALDVTVPAIKSLLVRARVGLVEAQEARDADCTEIRRDLHASYDRGVKASGRARRHLRECSGCREYRVALRSVRRSFAALVPPAAFGPLALAAKLLGAGGAGGGAAAAGTAGAGAGAGGGIVVVGGAAACKVAVVVCATAITAGGAVEMQRLAHHERANEQTRTAHKPKVSGRASVAAMVAARAPSAPVPVAAVPAIRTRRPAPVVATPAKQAGASAADRAGRVRDDAPRTAGMPTMSVTPPTSAVEASGGIAAPAAATPTVPVTDPTVPPVVDPTAPVDGASAPTTTTADNGAGSGSGSGSTTGTGSGSGSESGSGTGTGTGSGTTPEAPAAAAPAADIPAPGTVASPPSRTGAVEAPPPPPPNGVHRSHWGPATAAPATPAAAAEPTSAAP